jgi:hypothetical protein
MKRAIKEEILRLSIYLSIWIGSALAISSLAEFPVGKTSVIMALGWCVAELAFAIQKTIIK